MTNKIPYRNIPSNDLIKLDPKKGFFCRVFGCRGNTSQMEGFWYINSLILRPEIHFYTCAICGNDYSKISNDQFVSRETEILFDSEFLFDSEIWKENISKKNIDNRYEIPNFQFNKFIFKFICSKIGCRPKRFKELIDIDTIDTLMEFCARCNRLL